MKALDLLVDLESCRERSRAAPRSAPRAGDGAEEMERGSVVDVGREIVVADLAVLALGDIEAMRIDWVNGSRSAIAPSAASTSRSGT